MKWEVDLHDELVPEYGELRKDVQDELLAHMELLDNSGRSWDGLEWIPSTAQVTRT